MAPPASEIKFGAYLPQLRLGFPEIRDRVLACEDAGLDSIWFMDHLHPPGHPSIPSFEAWTIAAALAPLTRTIRIGHLVLANSFRLPALLAKMATTLDVVSSGRLEVGLGSGSFEPEHSMYGFPWESAAARSRKLGEALEIITRLFRDDSVTFRGEFYRLEGAVNEPKPWQKPNPPIWVGGAGERNTLPLVAKWADGWNCPTYALGSLEAKRQALAAECRRAGRDPATIRTSVEAVLVLAEDADELARAREVAEKRYAGPGWGLSEGGFIGTPDRIIERIRELARAGIDDFVFFFWDRIESRTLRLFCERVLPAFR